MPWYRWERGDPFRDHANDRRVTEGEVVELPEAVADPQPGFAAVDEPRNPKGSTGEDAEEYTCVGNDGDCSRTVDEEGGRCWQHADE